MTVLLRSIKYVAMMVPQKLLTQTAVSCTATYNSIARWYVMSTCSPNPQQTQDGDVCRSANSQ